MTKFRKVLTDSAGATAIEYALVATLISVAAIAGMGALGVSINTMYTNVSDKL
jgi:pilus assembly protein Flp/PilA